MLFNSFEFLVIYLPVALAGYFTLGGLNVRLAAAWLAVMSVVFYSVWNPANLPILLVSIVCNYFAGIALARLGDGAGRRWLLGGAIAGNLLALGFYKYINFVIQNIALVGHLEIAWTPVELPIGISFFTFTQIAFLVDVYRRAAKEYNFIHYALFVSYFPHLVAGPILHHKEMMPQFQRSWTYRWNWSDVAVGWTIFAIGLFKKVILADPIGDTVSVIYQNAHHGPLSAAVAWCGALGYALQIYFDFSGYSDMAIGLSRLFGVRLPLNFHSPYQATDIIEFWRRWHMTLSRFLRDYLYFSLGGNRRGPVRRYLNVMITMALGGLWHGAGWNFLIWGTLHGLYLVVNHAWRALAAAGPLAAMRATRLWGRGAHLLTFLAVVVAFVFFRADTLETARAVLSAMAGEHGGGGLAMESRWFNHMGPLQPLLLHAGVTFFGADLAQTVDLGTPLLILGLLGIALYAPNTQQILRRWEPALLDERVSLRPERFAGLLWRPAPWWAAACAALAGLSIMSLWSGTQFLYFQF